ncbi:sugar acetyltransferase inhibitor, partial [Escherichia coli]
IKTITYLSDTGCLEIQGASLIPISPLLLVWIIGRTFEPVIELYTDVTWESFSALHNKINPYKEN